MKYFFAYCTFWIIIKLHNISIISFKEFVNAKHKIAKNHCQGILYSNFGKIIDKFSSEIESKIKINALKIIKQTEYKTKIFKISKLISKSLIFDSNLITFLFFRIKYEKIKNEIEEIIEKIISNKNFILLELVLKLLELFRFFLF